MTDRVYISLVELCPRPGCPHVAPEVAGTFVRCYVTARSLKVAVVRIETACRAADFDVVSVDWCVDKDEVDWEFPDNATGNEHIARAIKTGQVVFGELYTWPHGSEDE